MSDQFTPRYVAFADARAVIDRARARIAADRAAGRLTPEHAALIDKLWGPVPAAAVRHISPGAPPHQPIAA
ncbi:hypothetical protein ACFU8I_37115 [Streptomyces sp. NPDC057540]|uniref:hypothetical protein n=1 Tax=Streptomyces sp. NPDC057540 TaxID=3346160 RepID=UPI003678D701